MQHSDTINELATALAKAQGEITGALKDSANPFFKSKYADLASCWDACREPLSKNGLAIIQSPEINAEGLTLTTLLIHSTGQWIKNVFRLMLKDDTAQGVGSALTYARRYALTALIGIAQVDDDGNAASGRTNGAYAEPHRPQGDLGKTVPIDRARAVAMEMLALIDEPAADGDHEEFRKALKVFDYHEKHLIRDEDLYVAVGDQLPAAKRNVWKALVNKAKKAEKEDRASDPNVRRF